MSAHNQPPAEAVADLPVAATVVGAFASVAGKLALIGQADKGAIALLAAAIALSLILPAGRASNLFLTLVGFAAPAPFGLKWFPLLLPGPPRLPAPGLGWPRPHLPFLVYGPP